MSNLNKQLTLLDIFCMASGSMISSGLFVLPALIYIKSGAAVVLVYLLASILVIPAVFAQAELATAMPKAGGTYFFIERSLGTGFGFFSGLANWFSISMKSAFALVGMAVFIKIVLKILAANYNLNYDPVFLMKVISVICCMFFMGLNIFSVKHASRLQNYLVGFLLLSILYFIVTGLFDFDILKFKPFFPEDMALITFFSATGMVFVSFGGITKVASVAEEIRKPSVNLPLGMFLAWFIVSALYFVVVAVTVGVMDHDSLANSLTPISDASKLSTGNIGYIILSLSAMTAFITTANAGLISASRSLMAMGRDDILPKYISKVSTRFRTPHISIIITGTFMILAIISLDLDHLVKAASALMLILYTLVNACVIIMRASKMQAYRPTFKSPLYPYIQIIAILIYVSLIVAMGWLPLAISAGFILFSIGWYYFYLSNKVSRRSAVMHLVEKVTDKPFQTSNLENELRDILLERDEITEDRFDLLIKNCEILDVTEPADYEDIFKIISESFEGKIGVDSDDFYAKLLDREAQGSTVIETGLAIPHVVIDGQGKFEVMIVRSTEGIKFLHAPDPVHCIFVLAGTQDERNYHLRALMAIAQIAQQGDFMKNWLECKDVQGIRNMILLSSRNRQS